MFGRANRLMNVRFTTNEIRFRITEDELHALLGGRTLTERLAFAQETFVFSMAASQNGDATGIDPGPWRLHVSAGSADLQALVAAGRSKRGIEHQCGPILVALQVDIRSHV